MELKLINFIFCFSLNPLEPCPLPQEEQYIVTKMTIATTIPIIHVQILTLVENEQSIFDMMFINHHLLSQSSTILLVQILTLVEKDAKERMLKFQASSPDSYFYVYRCTPLSYHFNLYVRLLKAQKLRSGVALQMRKRTFTFTMLKIIVAKLRYHKAYKW